MAGLLQVANTFLVMYVFSYFISTCIYVCVCKKSAERYTIIMEEVWSVLLIYEEHRA